MRKSTFVTIDIAILTAVAILLDLFTLKVFNNIYFSVSVSQFIILVVLFRWNYFAIFPAIIIGIFNSLIATNYSFEQMMVYSLGNLFILGNIIWFHYLGKAKLQKDKVLMAVFVISGFIFVSIGRGLIAGIIELNLAKIPVLIFQHFLVESLNMAIAIVLILIASSNGSFIIDMNQYLLELALIRKEEEGIYD